MSESDLLNQLNTQFITLEQRIQTTFDILSGTVPVAIGPIGNTGAQGQNGPPGSIGAQGIQGSTGPLGGPIGPTGSIGAQGTQGQMGPIGTQGAQGLIGITGSQGLQGPIGPIGSQGALGFGAQGVTGAQGQTGPQGRIGVQGPVGLGAQGLIGPIGQTGAQGSQGLSQLGSTGNTGTTGAQGLQGGLGGSLTWKGIYNSGSVYTVNDAVFSQGSSYIYAAGAPAPFAISTLISTGLNYPTSVAVTPSGILYIADNQNNVIRRRDLSGNVTIYAGSTRGYLDSVVATSARFNNPYSVDLDLSGNLYVADRGNNMIRKITTAGIVSTVAGQIVGGTIINGLTTAARFNSPSGIAVDSALNIYVADTNNNAIRKIDSIGNVTTYAGNQTLGSADGIGTAASFFNPIDVALDSTGSILYVADTMNNLIRKITTGANVVTFAGTTTPGHQDGIGVNATFYAPYSITVDKFGNIFVADNGNNCIRQITPTGLVVTVAGNITLAPDPYNRGSTNSAGGTNIAATTSSFYSPSGVAIDASGIIYIADSGNQLIRRGLPTGAAINLALMAQKGDVGPVGAQGAQGAQGVAGPQGTQGATGARADTGAQGIRGDTGTQGAVGSQGATGARADTGATGSLGTQGLQGARGDTGLAGTTGATGAQGLQGPVGAAGATSGFTGATGAGPYTSQGSFSITNGVSPQTVNLNAGTAQAPVFYLNQTGVYQISIFSYTNGTYFYATLGVYKIAGGFQCVFMGVTSYQLTLNLVSGPSITSTLTINGVANGNYYWSLALSAPYTLTIS